MASAVGELSPFLAAFRDRYFNEGGARDMWRRIMAAGKVSQPEPMDPTTPTYSLVATSGTTVSFRRDGIRHLFCSENLQKEKPMSASRWCAETNHTEHRLHANVNMLRDLIYTTIVDEAYTIYLYRLAGEDLQPRPINDLTSFVPISMRDLQLMTRFWKYSRDDEGRPSPPNTAAYLAKYGRTEHQHRFTLIKEDGEELAACVDIRAVLGLTKPVSRRHGNNNVGVGVVNENGVLTAPAPPAPDLTPVFRVLARTEARVLVHDAPHAFVERFGEAQAFRTLDEHAPAVSPFVWYTSDDAQPLLSKSAVREAVLALDAVGGALQTALLTANSHAGMSRAASNAIQAALAVSQRPSLILEAAMAASMRDEHLAHLADKPAGQYAYVAQFLCSPAHLVNALRATLAAHRIMAHVKYRDEPLVARRLSLYASAVRWAPPCEEGEMPLVTVEPDGNTLCWGYVDPLPASDTIAPSKPPSVPSTAKRPRDDEASVVVVGPVDPPPRPSKRARLAPPPDRCEPPNANHLYWPLPMPISERMRRLPGMKKKKEKITVKMTLTHCLSISVGIGIELFRNDALLVRTRGMQLDLPPSVAQGTLYKRLRELPPRAKTDSQTLADFNATCESDEMAAAVVVAILFFALFIFPTTPSMSKDMLPVEFHEALFGKDDVSAAKAYARNVPGQQLHVGPAEEDKEAAPLETFFAALNSDQEPDSDSDDDNYPAYGKKRGRPRDERLVLPNASTVAIPFINVEIVKRLIVDLFPTNRAPWYIAFQRKHAFLLFNNGPRPPVSDVIKLIELFIIEYKRHAATQAGHGAALTSSLSGVVVWLAFQHVVAACFLPPGQLIPRGPFSLTDFDTL